MTSKPLRSKTSGNSMGRRFAELADMPDDTPDEVRRKAEAYRALTEKQLDFDQAAPCLRRLDRCFFCLARRRPGAHRADDRRCLGRSRRPPAPTARRPDRHAEQLFFFLPLAARQRAEIARAAAAVRSAIASKRLWAPPSRP